MENLEPYKIEKIDTKFERKGDLLYHEGPLLSHFVNKENTKEHYFYKWSDCDEQYNRWEIFKVSIENLESFFAEKITLLQLIKENAFVYFVDVDTNLNQINAFVCPTAKIPNDYLPSENSFFKEKQYEAYALELQKEVWVELKQKELKMESTNGNQEDKISKLFDKLSSIEKTLDIHGSLIQQSINNNRKTKTNMRGGKGQKTAR